VGVSIIFAKNRNLQHPRFLDQHGGGVSLTPPHEAVRTGSGRCERTPWEQIAKITEQATQMGGTKALLQRDAYEQTANDTSLEPIVDGRLGFLFENCGHAVYTLVGACAFDRSSFSWYPPSPYCETPMLAAGPAQAQLTITRTTINVVAKGIGAAPGAIVYQDMDAVGMVFDRYSDHWEEAGQDAMTGGQSRLIRGPAPPSPAPYLNRLGCTLVPPGTKMTLSRGSIVPVVAATMGDGKTVHGVTLGDMFWESEEDRAAEWKEKAARQH
jgi:hypothetical protein